MSFLSMHPFFIRACTFVCAGGETDVLTQYTQWNLPAKVGACSQRPKMHSLMQSGKPIDVYSPSSPELPL